MDFSSLFRSLTTCGLGWALLVAGDLRSEVLLDDHVWRFRKISTTFQNCTAADFPITLDNQECAGLQLQAQVNDADWCQRTCCEDSSCEVWQWRGVEQRNVDGSSSDLHSEVSGSLLHGGASDFDSPLQRHNLLPKKYTCWTGRKTSCGPPTVLDIKSRARNIPTPPVPGPDPPVGTDCRAVMDSAYCDVSYDDSDWERLTLPHDFLLTQPISQQNGDASHGFRPGAQGWYRLVIGGGAGGGPQQKALYFDFGGVMRDAKVFLNGKFLGRHASGYTSFSYDATQFWDFSGGPNLLAVFCDATKPDGWWYDGGGIYRHVHLRAVPKLHIAKWGVYLPTHVVGPVLSVGGLLVADAELQPRVEVVNTEQLDKSYSGLIQVLIQDELKMGPSFEIVSAVVEFLPNRTTTVVLPVTPREKMYLWHTEIPVRYTATTTLRLCVVDGQHGQSVFSDDEEQDDEITSSQNSPCGSRAGPTSAARAPATDTTSDTFGVRKLWWDADTGFYLNDVSTKIQGFANHQDFGPLGVAVPDDLQLYRVAQLKQMGANGWRTAHNPPTEALLEATDILGMLVWDENHRLRADGQWWEDLEMLIR